MATEQKRRPGKKKPVGRVIHHAIHAGLGGLAASLWIHRWMSTLDFQASYYDPTVDPVRSDFQGPLIAVFWHEYLLMPFYLRGNTHSAILTSRHRDAEWLSQAARHMGFETIRGSTNRGGTQALLQFMRDGADRNLGIACDGPRGPRRQVAPGPIFLSSRLQVPIVIYGIGYERLWRMPTWDRFALPKPYSKARIIMSPRIQIPAKLDRHGLERYRLHIESILLRLTREAETWARSHGRRPNQTTVRRQPRPLLPAPDGFTEWHRESPAEPRRRAA